MAILHIVNQSPSRWAAYGACLARMGDGDSLLLIEDGVYAALKASEAADLLVGVKVYALAPDLSARGLGSSELREGLETVDYDGFVDLAARHAKVLSWN